jgi:two-component system, NtrC family, sensor kinase
MTNVETVIPIPVYSYETPLPQGAAFSFNPEVISKNKLSDLLKNHNYFLLLVYGKSVAIEILKISKSAQTEPNFRIIVLDSIYSSEDVARLINQPSIIKVLKVGAKMPAIDAQIISSLDVLKSLRESDNIISKVRVQNKVLTEINENLEDIVRQRTENLEQSKIAVESTLRGVKDLIKFVKNLAQINNFDDLIILLRQEFLKFHKMRAPLLIYSLGGSEVRCIFFQGPQIIDQVLPSTEAPFFANNSSAVREALANALERPIGPVMTLPLLIGDNKGILVFEHSFSEVEQNLFQQILSERTESLRVAFERLALKWRAHLISRQWSSTFDLLKDPILIIDRNFRVVRSNKKFSRHTGELCFQVFAARTEPCVGCPAIKSMSEHRAQSSKVNCEEQTYDVEAFPIVVEGTLESANWIVHYKDVTRSANLQGQLVQSEKMAAIGMLAGNIAHELNNPLTGIKSLAQILLSEVPKESSVYSDLKEVQGASERCEQIIKNLLEFSTGKSNDWIHCSLQDVIKKTLPFLKTAMHYFNSSIELAEGSDMVFVDPQLLQQVVFNLVNNACQAMGSRGTIHIESEIEDTLVRVRVRDTGPGVPAHLRQEIFAPFFTTKDEGQGTGLGLSVSRSIIEKFSGKLYLNEALQEGCEFVIELPRSNI